MLISTETASFKKYGDNFKIIKLIKDSGFDAYDFSMFKAGEQYDRLIENDNYIQEAQKLRQYADEIGILCNQTHAPFASAKLGNEEYNKEQFPYLIRALEVSSVLGAKICVIHPCNDYTAEQNFELYSNLLPYAKKLNVKIATENMWNWNHGEPNCCPAACSHHDDFLRHCELVSDEYLVACVDLGHTAMKGLNTSAYETITVLGNKYVKALHIHDNDGIHDNHALPFTYGSVDFESVIKALKEINYDGDITLESASFSRLFPKELYASLTRLMADVANYIRSKVLEK